jgi:glycosyltransferase involved in cell wall biosynthesis
MKILFLVPYPLKEAPSQRFRFEQYLRLLHQHGSTFTIQSFLSLNNWRVFSQSGNHIRKYSALINGFGKRFIALLIAPNYDFIFIHREATPVGPPIAEWILVRILKKKIIFDFDDAIWLTDRKTEDKLMAWLKCRSKIAQVCSWSYKVSAGNSYLVGYAKQFCANTILLPTTIDTEYHHKSSNHMQNSSDSITIGWTGSYSTLKYLSIVQEALKKIEIEFPSVSILIIADQRPALSLPRWEFIPWNANSEIDDLLKIDIGIMPLPDDEWTKGKCGFKALQYMSLEIPTIASPVGVNGEIIDHGVSGYLANSEQEWLEALRALISNPSLRSIIGKKGKHEVDVRYSTIANSPAFLSLFQ